jgi:nucleotide-binding universal stress UspA family protein
MKRVLLPTDFSDNAWKAMCYAAQLYSETPVKYYILNNYSAPYDPVEAGIISYFEPLKKTSQEGLNKIEQRFKDLDHHPATEFETVSTYGPVHATIQSFEDKEPEPHIVVMGTKGASGLAELFLGTTTVGVIRNIKSPVIAVPASAKLEEPKIIMLAIDSTGVDRLAEIRPLIEVAQNHDARIAVVNVHVPEAELVLEKDAPEEYVLDHYLEKIPHSYHSIDGEYVEDRITQFAGRIGADMIALIHRDRGFWRNLFHASMANRLAYHSDIPLFILKDK